MKSYHISKTDLGELVILTPKVPTSFNKVYECSVTNRVCFSPSIIQCMIAIGGSDSIGVFLEDYYKLERNPVIYVTESHELITPIQVGDFSLTGELWSTSDIEVNRVGYIDLNQLMNFNLLSITDEITNTKFSISDELYDIKLSSLTLI